MFCNVNPCLILCPRSFCLLITIAVVKASSSHSHFLYITWISLHLSLISLSLTVFLSFSPLYSYATMRSSQYTLHLLLFYIKETSNGNTSSDVPSNKWVFAFLASEEYVVSLDFRQIKIDKTHYVTK